VANTHLQRTTVVYCHVRRTVVTRIPIYTATSSQRFFATDGCSAVRSGGTSFVWKCTDAEVTTPIIGADLLLSFQSFSKHSPHTFDGRRNLCIGPCIVHTFDCDQALFASKKRQILRHSGRVLGHCYAMCQETSTAWQIRALKHAAAEQCLHVLVVYPLINWQCRNLNSTSC